MISLLDLATHYPIDAWVVFRNLPDDHDLKWYMRPLKDGFRHVEVWVRDRGVWVRVEPTYDMAVFEAHLESPYGRIDPELKPTYVRFREAIRFDSLGLSWHFGPITCVTAVKLVLGLRAPWVHTPYQLYRHLATEGS